MVALQTPFSPGLKPQPFCLVVPCLHSSQANYSCVLQRAFRLDCPLAIFPASSLAICCVYATKSLTTLHNLLTTLHNRPEQPPPATTPRCRRPVRNRSVPPVHSASKPSCLTARTRPTASSPTGIRRDRQQPPRGAAPPDAPLANHPPTNSPSAQRVSRRPPGNTPPK